MKKIFTILLSFISLSLFATRYYIAPAGTDGGGHTGLIADPWKTLDYACTQVASPDTIYVNAGNYTETNRCELAVGVSIYGAGYTSHIISTYEATSSNDASITLVSGAGTSGNQSISYIRLDGNNLAGHKAILVYGRRNVKIHHCTITNFQYGGIRYSSTAYETGNEVYNDTITNCSTRNSPMSFGLIYMAYQSGMLIHDNVLTQDSRVAGENGNIMFSETCKGIKYYNNKSYKPDDDGAGNWNFHWENWNCEGGFEVYDNLFNGGTQIDCAGNGGVCGSAKGTYAYSWWIHDNTFELDNQYPTYTADYKAGITIEANAEYMIINNNHFKNLPWGITFSIVQSPRTQREIYIYYNIFENIGWGDDQYGFCIFINANNVTSIQRNINIYNNVISSGTTGQSRGGVYFNTTGDISAVNIINNIIQNFVTYGCIVFRDGAGAIDSISIKNNILYNNVSGNDFYYWNGKIVTNLVNTGNIESDPKFNDFVAPQDTFSLQVGSPAINAGLGVGLNVDYLYYLVDATPDIGAYEYGASGYVPPDPPTVTTSIPLIIYTRLASGGGNVTSDGGGSVTDRGICWSTSANPTTSGSHLHCGTGTGTFSEWIQGLTANTTYHVRAFAQNETGVSYGSDIQFTTPVHSIPKTGGKILKTGGKIVIIH